MEKKMLCSLAAFALIAGSSATVSAACVAPSTSQNDTLMGQLDSAHQEIYNTMDCEGKNMTMKLTEQGCKGKNSCKGQNSCAGESNSCAGQGSCKGSSKGPFTDKNKAVDVAQKLMASKRMQSMRSK